MARFQREAEVLAALNHPNIAAIYGLEENALIMELVEGETLSSPLPVDAALPYARQIAEALEYAHERGVIHRDLKPANVKVTCEGVVKLLDFGIAKAVDNPAAPSGDPANSPTQTLGMTGVGVIMGTAAYMSPEQAGGKTADRRADIWSFGAVLYEMLAGKRAFAGESAADILASVLKLDPDWGALPGAVPASIHKLVRQCLRKDRKQRLQAIGDARIAIEEALAGAPPGAPQGEEVPAPPTASRRSILPWAAAAGVLAIVAAMGWWTAWRITRPVDRPLLRLSVDLGPDAVAADRITAAISPDGTRLVFLARGSDGKTQLATRLLDQPQATLLAGTADAAAPFFSPNGEWIGFFAEGKMKKVSVRGSA
ncbi:MAG: serine/threonine-protein kinase, partial [Candidatus Solibacter usitatus]|nr:serine/threonine-protein kinase [Candidatus Solibacter usitatus]